MIWTVLFLAVIVSYAVFWFVSWRLARNFALRLIVLTRQDENVFLNVVVDFVDMLALSRHVLVETEPGAPEWPELHRLRRLDGPRWEAVPETAHWQHRVDQLRASLGRRSAAGFDLARNAASEEQKELEALTSDTPVWEEWGWGSQAEAAFQLFVRRYRPPTAAAEASLSVPSLVDAYSREWKHEMTTWLRTSEKASPSGPSGRVDQNASPTDR